MKKTDWKTIWSNGLSGSISLVIAVLIYFIMMNFGKLYGAFQELTAILSPFIIGGVLAYLLKKPCNFIEKQLRRVMPDSKKASSLAVLLVFCLTVLMFYLLMILALPEIVNSISVLIAIMPYKVNQFTQWASNTLSGNEVLESYVENFANDINQKLQRWMRTDLLPLLKSMMGNAASTVGTTVGSVVMTLKNLIIGLIVCIYLLLERKHFAKQGKALLYAVFKPELAGRMVDEAVFIDKTFGGFFIGKLVDSAIVGVICYIFCLIMSVISDFPNAVLVSVIVGITNIIPYFGPFIGAVPSALLIFISSPQNCLIFLIFVVILQQIDGNIIGPRILAGSVGMSGFWVLFSITLFSGIFGFVGILIGVPVFAVIYNLVHRLVVRGLKYHEQFDMIE